MQADLLVVQMCEFLDDGDGVYRFHSPSRGLSRLPGVVAVDCDLHHRFLPRLAEAADVLILGGFDSDLVPLIERRRAAGRITVFEANDYFMDVHPWNPLATKWLDRAIQDSFTQGLTLCDAVQASTAQLCNCWRERTARPVAVFTNQLPELGPLPPLEPRPLTIGWGGSPGHFADWFHIAPWLEEWLTRRPDVRLAVMTNDFAKPFLRLPPERYRFVPFGSLADYLKFLAGLDIGLAPLLPTPYNRCRSDVKFLEYASCGVAGVYADLEPYRASVVQGQTGLFYRTKTDLFDALDRLAGDADLRGEIRSRAYDYVARQRRLEDHIGERLEFYRSLLCVSGESCLIDPEALAAARQDGRYLQLYRQQPEATMLAAVAGAASRESAGALERLVAEQPGYLAAAQHLGRILNDLREHAAAIHCLERAKTLDPQSARTLCEIGRAYFVLGDVGRARQVLEAALAINPYYHLGWQYFLRLLILTRAADAKHWAEEAHRRHPANFPLALMGVKLYAPGEAVAQLRRAVGFLCPDVHGRREAARAAAFSECIREVTGPQTERPEVLQLLRQACAVFPQSALLANLLAAALGLAGQQEESYAEYARAIALRRTALTYQAEYAKEDGAFHFGQFAEQILGAGKELDGTLHATDGETAD